MTGGSAPSSYEALDKKGWEDFTNPFKVIINFSHPYAHPKNVAVYPVSTNIILYLFTLLAPSNPLLK